MKINLTIFFQDLDEDGKFADDLLKSPLYFTRTRGLFRECFPGEKDKNAPQGKCFSRMIYSY